MGGRRDARMTLLLSDTSVLTDLERAELMPLAFGLGHNLAASDVLYDRELEAFGGPTLIAMGLRVESAHEHEAAAAQAILLASPGLSVADAFALALAKARDWEILSTDFVMRSQGKTHGVACRDTLWLFDELEAAGTCPVKQLGPGLTKLTQYKRCRLPLREVKVRLERYAAG